MYSISAISLSLSLSLFISCTHPHSIQMLKLHQKTHTKSHHHQPKTVKPTPQNNPILMEDSFHFALLRVSIIQILKSAGFDKCKPSVINTLTALYIEYFKLLLQTTNKYTQHRGDIQTEVAVQDITAALLEVGFLKPSSFESNLDAFDVPSYSNLHDYSTKSAEAFKNWLLYSDHFNILKKLATVPRPLLKSLVQKRKVDDDKLNKDQKQRKLKKKQEFYNQFQGSTNGTTGGPGHHSSATSRDVGDAGYNDGINFNDDEDDDDDDEAVDSIEHSMNWLRYASEKDLKLGTDLRWINTALDDETRELLMNDDLHPIDNKENRVMEQKYGNYCKDHEVIGDLEGSYVETLPYKISYNPELLDDLIELYEDYVRRHPRPVSPEISPESEEGEDEKKESQEEKDEKKESQEEEDEKKESQEEEDEKKESQLEEDEKKESEDNNISDEENGKEAVDNGKDIVENDTDANGNDVQVAEKNVTGNKDDKKSTVDEDKGHPVVIESDEKEKIEEEENQVDEVEDK